MNMTSLETGLLYNPWLQIFDAKKLPRSYRIQMPAYTRARIWVREGGGDTPIWGPYSKMEEISTPQGGNKTFSQFLSYLCVYSFSSFIEYFFILTYIS